MSTEVTQTPDKDAARDKGNRNAGGRQCKFYQTTGGCRVGATCKFRHVQDPQAARHIVKTTEEPPNSVIIITSPTILPTPLSAPREADSDCLTPSSARSKCKFYQATEGCKFGAKCRFEHVQGGRTASLKSPEAPQIHPIAIPSPLVGPIPSLSPSGAGSRSSRARATCKFHQAGGCRLGANCEFQHLRGDPAESLERVEDHPTSPIVFPSAFPGPIPLSIALNGFDSPIPNTPRGICKFYQATGHCRLGLFCKFHHILGVVQTQSSGSVIPCNIYFSGPSEADSFTPNSVRGTKPPNPAPANASDQTTTCRVWKTTGTCPRGDECLFQHDSAVSLSNTRNKNLHPDAACVEEEKCKKELEILADQATCEVEQQERRRHQIEFEEYDKREVERIVAGARAAIEAKAREEEERRAEQERRKERERKERKEEQRRLEQERLQEQHRAEQARLLEEQRKRELERLLAETREEGRRRAEQARRRREEQERKRKENKERQEAARRAKEEQRRLEQELRAEEERRRGEEQLERERIARANLEAKRHRDATAVEGYLVSDSAALITCSAGLEVQHVVAGFDLCKITIKGLPKNATHAEIADLLAQQGVNTHEFTVSQLKDEPTTHGSKIEAVVIANAEYGGAITAGLDGIVFRDEILKSQANDNVSRNAMAMGGTGSGAPFLTISWRTPPETIIASYATQEEACTNIERINGQMLHDHRIRAVLNKGPPNKAASAAAYSMQVKINGWPLARMSERDFVELVGTTNLKALRVMPYNHEQVTNSLRLMVGNQRGVQIGTYEFMLTANNVASAGGEEWRVKVLFDDWEDAKLALGSIDKTKLDNGPCLRAWHPKPLQYSIKISTQQYQAQKKIWDALAEKKPESETYVHTTAGHGDRSDLVFVRVVGDDKKAAGSLKVRVESLVAGERLDATYWHSSFFSKDSKPLFDRVRQETSVFVRSDFKTRSLKIYGERDRVEEAKRLIKEEVDRLSQVETMRFIPHASVAYFVREGLGRLKELLGEDNVDLNLITRQITIKGGEEARHHLQRLIDESYAQRALGGVFQLPGAVENRETSCPVCFGDASTGEQLGCGHRYCADCLRDFLRTAGETKDFKFPLVCLATVDDAMCNVAIAIPLLRAFLTPQAFEHLVEAAFTSYLEKHPQELKYCTTPDCKQIYRRCSSNDTGKKKARSDALQCPSCFSIICPGCDEEAHEGMTCEERRIQGDPAEQDRLNDELASKSGYKRCPRCQLLTEKVDGCNHMTCKCGAHFCWRCMAAFDTSQQTYDHMNATHGGFYNEMPEGIQEAEPNANLLQEQLDAFAEIEERRLLEVLHGIVE